MRKLTYISYGSSAGKDITSLGINPLTSESDAYGMGRILCDLSADGKELVCSYFGIPSCSPFAENWNSQVGSAVAVASIMLSRQDIWELMVFNGFRQGYRYVIVSLYGVTYLNEDMAEYEVYRNVCLNYPDTHTLRQNASSAPSVDGRSIHAFTGRTE